MKETWAIITTIVGVTMSLIPTLHILRMRKEQSSKGQSAIAPFVGSVAYCVWLIYGFSFCLWPVILTNTSAIVIGVIWGMTVLFYRKRS